MKAQYVGNGTVDPSELAHHLKGIAPAGAEAAELAGNTHGQQAAGAQGIPLRNGRTATLVAFDRAVGELAGPRPRGVQRGKCCVL